MSTDERSTRRTVVVFYLAALVVFAATFIVGGYTVGLLSDAEFIGSSDDPNYLQAGVLTPSESGYLGGGYLTPTGDSTEDVIDDHNGDVTTDPG